MTGPASHIGTLRESHLHAALKRWCSLPGDLVEAPVDGYVIDLVRDDLLIEVQTSGLSSMKRKAEALLDRGRRLRIVHPIPREKRVVRVDDDGAVLGRRRSPVRGAATDVFAELVGLPLPGSRPGLEIEVVLTVEDELRRRVPGRARRRKGWSVVERRLVDVSDALLITGPDDLAALLPSGLPALFTTADLAARLGRPRRMAQQMAYCLRKAGVIEAVGKSGAAVEYRARR